MLQKKDLTLFDDVKKGEKLNTKKSIKSKHYNLWEINTLTILSTNAKYTANKYLLKLLILWFAVNIWICSDRLQPTLIYWIHCSNTLTIFLLLRYITQFYSDTLKNCFYYSDTLQNFSLILCKIVFPTLIHCRIFISLALIHLKLKWSNTLSKSTIQYALAHMTSFENWEIFFKIQFALIIKLNFLL